MQPLLFSNSAQTTLAGAITNISTTAVLQSGAGALFPNPSTGQSFTATLIDAATGLIKEIVEVTSRAGDTVTIVRGRESTVATAYAAGDTFASLLTAGQVQSMTQGGNAISTYAGNPNGYVAGTSGTPGSTAPDMVWDSTHNAMWACETTGNAGAAVWASVATDVTTLNAAIAAAAAEAAAAQGTANTAVTNANTAQITANNAQTTASNATITADTAYNWANVAYAALPKTSGVGDWAYISGNGSFTIPAGGTWAYYFHHSSGSADYGGGAGIDAGGTYHGGLGTTIAGFAWRIS